jgi:hypothetical protein
LNKDGQYKLYLQTPKTLPNGKSTFRERFCFIVTTLDRYAGMQTEEKHKKRYVSPLFLFTLQKKENL